MPRSVTRAAIVLVIVHDRLGPEALCWTPASPWGGGLRREVKGVLSGRGRNDAKDDPRLEPAPPRRSIVHRSLYVLSWGVCTYSGLGLVGPGLDPIA